jgi:hypothetical protein
MSLGKQKSVRSSVDLRNAQSQRYSISVPSGSGGVEDRTGELDPLGQPLLAPITDVAVVNRKDKIPPGFAKIDRTYTNKVADLNSRAGGKNVFLCVARDTRGWPITDITVIFKNKGEVAPPGFVEVAKTPAGATADLNAGHGGERIFLCFKRGHGPPVVDLEVIYPTKKDMIPIGYVEL